VFLEKLFASFTVLYGAETWTMIQAEREKLREISI